MVSKPEQRAINALTHVQNNPRECIDLTTLANYKSTKQFVLAHLAWYPKLVLHGTCLLYNRQNFRFIAAVKKVICEIRTRRNKWALLARQVVLKHLEEQYQIEYELGFRVQRTCSAAAKAEAQIYEVYPTMALFQ